MSTIREQLAEISRLKLRELRGEDTGSPVEIARKKSLAGNPFPMLALQWPSLVITDPKHPQAHMFEGTPGDPDDPCIKIDPWQRSALLNAFDVTVGEVFMKGCTGAGKGFITSLILNLIYETYTGVCKINITSETSRHALSTLFAEFATWREAMEHPSDGRLLGGGLASGPKRYVQVLNPSPHGAGEAFSGQHASDGQTVYAFDEASAVPEVHYTNCLKNATKIFALSNPRITEGWFRDGFRALQGDGTKEERRERENKTGACIGRKGMRVCITIPGTDCTNVRFGLVKDPVSPIRGIEIGSKKYAAGERISKEDFEKVRAAIPGQIDISQYQSIIDTSSEKWEVECYAHAQFPSEDPVRQAILPSWIPRHVDFWKRTHESIRVIAFGLDVARSQSGDETVLVAGGIKGLKGIHNWKAADNMHHVRHILGIAKRQYDIDLCEGEVPICVDMGGGYGAGVSDRLRELGVWIIEFMPSGGPLYRRSIMANQRAEWYLLLAERLDPAGNWSSHPFGIPPNDELSEDLTSPMKQPIAGGTAWKLEKKDDISRRIGRSPDRGDAAVCCYRAIFELNDYAESAASFSGDIVVGTTSDEHTTIDESEEESQGQFPLPPGVIEPEDPLSTWLGPDGDDKQDGDMLSFDDDDDEEVDAPSAGRRMHPSILMLDEDEDDDWW